MEIYNGSCHWLFKQKVAFDLEVHFIDEYIENNETDSLTFLVNRHNVR